MSDRDDPARSFGVNAAAYARHRPLYPKELFQFLADECQDRSLAWDAATGNGQAAIALAAHFDRVLATDVSPEQVGEAIVHDRVHYQVSAAEKAPLHAGSASLITVAQAAHWFDLDRFYAEARRVLRPRGVIAIWSYAFARIEPAIDDLTSKFAHGPLAPYWSPRNRLVWEGYRNLPFPFELITAPAFEMKVDWDLAQTLGYLQSWSACEGYRQAKKQDPVAVHLEPQLRKAWGEPGQTRSVAWSLNLFSGLCP